MDAFWNGCFLVFLLTLNKSKKLSSSFAAFEQEKNFILLLLLFYFALYNNEIPKNLKKHFKKLQKYQHGLHYLMNTMKKTI